MKILHLLNTNKFSGAENVAISIIKLLDNDVDSTYVSREGEIRNNLNNSGIKFYPVKKLSVSNIKKAIKDIKPDIIHAHDFTASVITAFSTKNIPIISHLHNNPPWIKSINAKTLIYSLSTIKFKKIYVVSPAIIEEYIFKKSAMRKTEVIYNPILTRFIQERSKSAQISVPYDIVFIGRLTEQKNPLRFIKIIKSVKQEFPFLNVAMIGDGELLKTIENKITEYNLGETIKLLGFLDNPYGILKSSKILCITSKWEGFGLVAIEALALGKPVVATNVGGLSSIIIPKVGKLCNTDEMFVEELTLLLRNGNYYNKKAEHALEYSSMIDNEEKYYGTILNSYKEMYYSSF